MPRRPDGGYNCDWGGCGRELVADDGAATVRRYISSIASVSIEGEPSEIRFMTHMICRSHRTDGHPEENDACTSNSCKQVWSGNATSSPRRSCPSCGSNVIRATFRTPAESRTSDGTTSEPRRRLRRSNPFLDPPTLDSEESDVTCEHCGEDFPRDECSIMEFAPYDNEDLDGWPSRFICRECRRDLNEDDQSIIFCVECQDYVAVSFDWSREVLTPGGPSVCPEHSESDDQPARPCDFCERVRPRFYGTGFGDYICNSCHRGYQMCQVCSRYLHPESELWDSESHTCPDCTAMPNWFPSSTPEDWEYREGCPCRACRWLHEEMPEEFPTPVEIGSSDTDPRCEGCSRYLLPAGHRFESGGDGGGPVYCHLCATQNLVECDVCEGRFARSDVGQEPASPGTTEISFTSSGPFSTSSSSRSRRQICRECVPSGYWLCTIRCSRWYPDESLCDCEGVYSYNYSPNDDEMRWFYPVHQGMPDREVVPFLGIELEIEALAPNTSKREGAKIITAEIPWAYAVHDGSLAGERRGGDGGQNGFEIVTFPMTYAWFVEHFETEIAKLLDRLADEGYRSWEGERCGMHVHISRAPMSEAHQVRFVDFIYGSNKLALAVGQRGYKSRGVQQYASFTRENRARLVDKIRSNVNPGAEGHYAAINTMKPATLECRWFRGTLNPDSFRKNVEFVRATYDFTEKFGFRSTNEANFISWLTDPVEAKRFPALVSYLNKNYLI